MSTGLDHAGIVVTCPYCGNELTLPVPDTRSVEGLELIEVECVPYTRDVGRFDPKNEDDWFNPKGWSRIGKDFLPLLSYEHIGILRTTRKGINVQYRVQGCPSCKSLFDVYANYTPEIKFAALWPHLFEPLPNQPHAIKPYYGESWTIWILRRLGRLLKSNLLSAMLLGILLFGIGAFSYWLVIEKDEVFLDNIGKLSIFFVASLVVVIIVTIQEKFIHYFETTHEFYDLFNVINRKKGITHWRNFTLCRYVGVQSPGKTPLPTQIDILAGAGGQILLLITWLVYNYHRATLVLSAGFLLLLVVFSYLWGKYRDKLHHEKMLARVGYMTGLLLLVIGFILSMSFWVNLSLAERIEALSGVFELVFWLIVAYVLGTAAWFALSIVVYVLNGLSRIPMNLSPYDRFARSHPLRILQRYSTALMLTLVIAILVILTILQTVVHIDWLLAWVQWSLALMFAAIGVSLGQGVYLGMTIIYMIISWLIPDFYIIDGKVLAMGAFFTGLIAYQIFVADNLLDSLLEKSRMTVLDDLMEQIKNAHIELSRISEQIEIYDDEKHVLQAKTIARLQKQRQYILQSIESLLRLVEYVEQVSGDSHIMKRMIGLISPLITSLILPVFVEHAIALLFNF